MKSTDISVLTLQSHISGTSQSDYGFATTEYALVLRARIKIDSGWHGSLTGSPSYQTTTRVEVYSFWANLGATREEQFLRAGMVRGWLAANASKSWHSLAAFAAAVRAEIGWELNSDQIREAW